MRSVSLTMPAAGAAGSPLRAVIPERMTFPDAVGVLERNAAEKPAGHFKHITKRGFAIAAEFRRGRKGMFPACCGYSGGFAPERGEDFPSGARCLQPPATAETVSMAVGQK